MSSNEAPKCSCAHAHNKEEPRVDIANQRYSENALRQASCLCGAVELEFSNVTIKSFLCHCTDDRKISGSLFAHSLLVPDIDLTPSDSLKTYTRRADSGNMMTYHFCENCGTTMYRASSGFPGIVVIAAGTVDGELPKPEVEQWTKGREEWLPVLVEGEKTEQCCEGWSPNK